MCEKGATLALSESRLLPLMARSSFQRWAATEGSNWKIQFDLLESKLYDSMDNNCNDTKGVPLGILCLFSLMNKPSKELYGLSVDAKADGLDEVLGSGACAVVFRRRTKTQDSAMKVSRYGVKDGIVMNADS